MPSLAHKNTTSTRRFVAHAISQEGRAALWKNEITMNMHLHAHLKSCIEDYGPLHGYTTFERYNGILENFSNNNRCIEAQLMERFFSDIAILSAQLPTEYSDTFGQHFSSLQCNSTVGPRKLVGSLADTVLFSGDECSSLFVYVLILVLIELAMM